MQLPRPVGREAATRKYDLLSVLMAYALAEDKHVQRQVLRLMALVTARYNWQRDELTMGQGEIAKLWSVDERTVKREMAKLRARDWLVLKRQGARGRVSVYGLNSGRILADTEPNWLNVGPDLVARLVPGDGTGLGASNVVPLRAGPVPQATGTLWSSVQARLHGDNPAIYGAWYHQLTEAGVEAGCLTLAAPSSFHARYIEMNLKERLLAVVRAVEPGIATVMIVA
jgi:hypothetical protein